MTSTSSRGIILGLFLTTLVFHMAVAWQDFGVLAKNGFLYDDAFYAFKIAANIADGQGMTFDGVTPTNGFQPLYVFLLVPIFWASGANLTTPVYGALSLAALLTAFSAVLLFKLLRRYVGQKAALVASVLWAFSPVVTRQAANGLETALALLLFAACVYFYVNRIRPVDRPPRKDFLIMGLLLGLAVLARVDAVLVALAILVDYLLLLRSRRAGVRALLDVGVGVAAGIILYGPWLLVSAIGTGSLLQDSGAATRFISVAYAPLFNIGQSEMLSTGPNATFIWEHFMHALAVLKAAPPVHVVFRGVEKAGIALGARGAFQIVAHLVAVLLAGLFAYVILWPQRRGPARAIGELRFLLIVVVGLISAYSAYVFGLFFFTRYLYPVYFIACVYAAFLIEMLVGWLGRQAVVARSLTVALLLVYACGFAYMAYAIVFRSSRMYYFYDAAQWVNEHTDREEKIGVFQGGMVGYFADRKVINLDGKVNRHALDALRNHQLSAYLEREGIDVILDSSNVLDLFLFEPGTGRAPGHISLEKIMHGARDGIPGWAAYRIHPWDGGGTGSVPTTPRSSSVH